MAQVVELAYRADISQLVQNLGKIPGVTEKEAKAMVKSLDRQMKKAEASSKRAAQGTQKAWSKAGGPLKSFEKDAGRSEQVIRGLGGALDQINPKLGGMLDYSYEAAGAFKAIAKSGAGVASILGPVAVAAAGLAAAYTYLANEVKVAEERMKSAAAAASAMQSTHRAAELIALQAAVAIGEKSKAEYDAAVNSDRARQMYEGQTKALRESTAAINDELVENKRLMDQRAENVRQSGMSDKEKSKAKNKYTALVNQNTRALQMNAQKQAVIDGEITKTEKHLNQISQAHGNKTKTSTKSHRRGAKGAKTEATAIAELWKTSEEHATARLEGADAIILAARKEIDAIDALAASYPKSAAAAEAAAAARTQVAISMEEELADHAATAAEAEAEAIAKTADAREAANAKALAGLNEQAEAEATARAEAAADAAEYRAAELEGWDVFYGSMMQGAEQAFGLIADAHEDAANEVLETAEDATAAAEDALAEAEESGNEAAIAHAQNELAKTEASEEAAQEIATVKMASAVRAFHAEQAASVASVAMSTAQAIMAALVPPPIGYGPIAGPAAAAGLAAQGAVQVAGIMAQEPPSFHTGGMVRADERGAILRAGEGVLTAQGVRNVGGAGGVSAANAGRQAAAPVVVQHVYKHRNLDTVVVDHLKTNSALRKATSSSRARGRRNPYNGSL